MERYRTNIEKSRAVEKHDARNLLAERGAMRSTVENKKAIIPTEHAAGSQREQLDKRVRPGREDRDQAKGIILAVKSSAFRIVDDYVNSKLKIKNFDSAKTCIETVGLFLLEHFGPMDAPERLDNMFESIEARYEACHTELEIYRKMFSTIKDDNALFGRISKMPIAGPLTANVWKALKLKNPTMSGDVADINISTFADSVLDANALADLDPEMLSHFEFCKKMLKNKEK